MNMSIVKPGILGRCFIFLVNAECVGIGCHWHGTQENTIFSWNLVLSSLYFILWLWKKNKHLKVKFATHLREAPETLYKYRYWSDSPRWFVPNLCNCIPGLCVCVSKNPTDRKYEGGRERERESGNIVLHNANTSNGFRSSPGVQGANHLHFYPPFWSVYPGHQFWPMHGS